MQWAGASELVMTTYTSLLSGDPYVAEDWTTTIRENHPQDLPQLNKLRAMIRKDAAQSYYRDRVIASYEYLVSDLKYSQYSLDQADRDLIRRVISIFRQELG